MKAKSVMFIVLVCAALAVSIVAYADSPLPSGSTGYYQIFSNAEGSSVYFDAAYQGQIRNGEIIVPVDLTGPTYQTYTLRTPGGNELHGYLAALPLPGKTIILHADITPESVDKSGSLTILAEPPGASVYINGTFAGTIPTSGVLQFPAYRPGNYVIELRLAGYMTYSKNFLVSPSAETTLNILLNRSTSGGIDFISFPKGALVFLDGSYVGTTPLHLGNISPGTHEARIELAGYQEWDAVVLATPDVTVPVTARLFPLVVQTVSPTATRTKLGFPTIALFVALIVASFMIIRRKH